MRLLQIIKETIVYRKIFKKIKNLDSKYFATLCDNWKEIQKLDCAYCYPYENINPNFGHSTSEVPISVGIEAILKNDLKANSIVLRKYAELKKELNNVELQILDFLIENRKQKDMVLINEETGKPYSKGYISKLVKKIRIRMKQKLKEN